MSFSSPPKTLGHSPKDRLLVTKTLLIAGEGSGGAAILHAYDKATGADIAQIPMPGPQVSLPMSYMLNGRQFIILGVRGSAANIKITFPEDLPLASAILHSQARP